MKRISGGQTSVGADAKLLSSHAGDPRAATGDKTNASQTGQLIRPVEQRGLESARRRPEELPAGPDATGPQARDADTEAWFVIDAVAEMELGDFYGAYRADGHGRAAYEPSVMVALILYAFATSVRSSRAIECHCRQDVAFRVITGNLVPDHATIARFICRHEQALADLFTEVLKLCNKAGLVGSGWCRSTGAGSPAAPTRMST
jgi:transposase